MLWPVACFAAGVGRSEHLALFVATLALVFATTKTHRLFAGLVPFALLGFVYDSMRWIRNIGLSESRVLACDLRNFDMKLLKATHHGKSVPIHDWLQAHASLGWDLLFAVPYATFLFVSVAFAVLLYRRNYQRMQAFGWAFFAMNVAGFVTYHVAPAAPPWYVRAYGCAVDLHAKASEGANLARVDAWLGWPYFHAMYSRSSDVFGALPSLHVSYPMLIALFGWPVLGTLGRTAIVTFTLLMCGAAVYLDHHWVSDVLLGLGYAIATYAACACILLPTARRWPAGAKSDERSAAR